MPQRVVVAISGGVDSAVVAAAAVAAADGRDSIASPWVSAGAEIVGMTILLGPGESAGRSCSTGDHLAAARVAGALGIEHLVIDMRERFTRDVIVPFGRNAERGVTTNPCITCNAGFKFDELSRQAAAGRWDIALTGHYARTIDAGGETMLARAASIERDQSYVLATSDVRHVRFPLGAASKNDTRELAAHYGLDFVTQRRDSMGLCFDRPPVGPEADIVADGMVIGRAPIDRYTVGQRLRLGGLDRALYVARIDPDTKRIDAVERDLLPVRHIDLGSWTGQSGPAMIQTSAHGTPFAGQVTVESHTARITTSEPVGRVAAGQLAVGYRRHLDTDVVIGAGEIAGVRELAAADR